MSASSGVIFHWMLPFISHLYPDQDFILHYALIQTEYLFSMKTGTFPLNIVWHLVQNNQWGGMAGVFNPLFYLTALLPGYATGNALDWNVFLVLVMLIIAHLALFSFLQKIISSNSIAFLLSLITVYSPRLLLSFSVGGALTVWPGYLLLCTAVGFYCLNPSGYKRPLTIIFLAYWLVSSGYPEETYFSLLGVGLFTLFIPFLMAEIFPGKPVTAKAMTSFWGHTATYFLIGALLSAAFVLPFLLDIVPAVGLSQKNYAEACVYSSTIQELISNFFLPLRSSPSGLLGGSPLLLVAILIPALALFRVKIPGIIWLIWGMTALVLTCMLGDNTPIHYYLWKYFPLYSLSRYANRISMLLPVLFMLMLIWLFAKPQSETHSISKIKMTPLSILSFLALLTTLFYVFFMLDPIETIHDSLTKTNLQLIPFWVESLLLASGVIALITAAVYGVKNIGALKTATGLILCVVTCLQLIVFFRYAPLVRKKIDRSDIRTFAQFLDQKKEHVDMFLERYIHGFEKVLYPDYALRQWKQAGPQPLLAKIYNRHINVDNLVAAYAILDRGKQEDVLVVAGYQQQQENCNRTLSSTDTSLPDTVRLTYNSNNRLVFNARAGQPAFFMFSYHRTGHWRALVNGNPAVTYAADGNAHAVRIPAGESVVEFRYWSSAAFAGMLISCATLAGIGLFFGIGRIRGPSGYGAATTTVALAAALMGVWYHSLYAGDNLRTRYNWQAPARDAPRNMAYNKPARASLPPFGPLRLNLIHGSDYAVDGGRSFASCFSTGTQESPWLEIDLLQPQLIGTITLYAGLQGRETDNIVWFTQDSVKIDGDYNFLVFDKTPVTFNLLPLTVSVSLDHEHWETAQINRFVKNRPLTIQPEKPVTARYVRIAASGECRLCLNEVEVYPPLPDQDSISRE